MKNLSLRTKYHLVLFCLFICMSADLGYLLLFDDINILFEVFMLVNTVAFIILLAYFVSYYLLEPLDEINRFAQSLSEPGLVALMRDDYPEEIEKIMLQLRKIDENIEDAELFVNQIGQRDFSADMGSLKYNEGLGMALSRMRDQLQSISDEEAKRNWSVNGVAIFSDLLRDNQNAEIAEISFLFIKKIITYVDALQGAIYLINNDNPQKEFIENITGYANERRKFLDKQIAMGEGLVGRCVLENDSIYIDDLPAEYMHITSGLGNSKPKSLLLAPIRVNEKVYGVAEIASFHTLETYQIEFIRIICQSFGATVANAKINVNTKQLLKDSGNIASKLAEKEAEFLKEKAQFLTAKMQLEAEIATINHNNSLNNSLLTGLLQTHAKLEISLEGIITSASNLYLETTGYVDAELLGYSERIIIPTDEIKAYESAWKKVLFGQPHTGEFKRTAKDGSAILLKGTYLPAFDEQKKLSKVVLLARVK